MRVVEDPTDTTIHDGTLSITSNIARDLSTANDLLGWNDTEIVALLLSHSAPAGLLDASEHFNAPKCNESKKGSIIQGMKKFVRDDNASPASALYWLHGPAGVGKSALCQSLSLLLQGEGDHAASFFFSRTAPGRTNGNQLLVSLTYQLAINFPVIQPFMSKAVKTNPAIFSASNAIQMQGLIIGPINQWHKKYTKDRDIQRGAHKSPDRKRLYPRLILIDGLDQCDGPDVQRDLISCIGLAVHELSLPFRFVIASCPQPHILATFELDQALDGVRITKKSFGYDGNVDMDKQTTEFLLKEFAEIRKTHPLRRYLPKSWPLPDQIARLVSNSSKGFTYPATAIRYIKMPTSRPDKCLEIILGSSEILREAKSYEPLDVLYRHIFESVPEIYKASVREIFHFLVFPNDTGISITPRLIETHCNYKHGHVRRVLHNLLCIVACTGDHKPIEVLHTSLSDFLLDQSRSDGLCINIADAHDTISALFPLFLDKIDPSLLPSTGYDIKFLKHMMSAKMSVAFVYRKLLAVDFTPRYMRVCDSWPIYVKNASYIPHQSQHLEGTAFVAAYFLILAIKNVPPKNIRVHTSKLKSFLVQKYPLAASLHAVHNVLAPATITLLRNWVQSALLDQYIDYIFAYEVPASQCDIRQEIFEVYLLMMVPSFDPVSGDNNYFHQRCLQPLAQPPPVQLSHISHALLRFLIWDGNGAHLTIRVKHLAADLLQVSLAYADYSALLVAALDTMLNKGRDPEKPMQYYLPRLASSVTDYLQRVCSAVPAASQQEILELNNAWKYYLNQDNVGTKLKIG